MSTSPDFFMFCSSAPVSYAVHNSAYVKVKVTSTLKYQL
jgi:hypothetical protein